MPQSAPLLRPLRLASALLPLLLAAAVAGCAHTQPPDAPAAAAPPPDASSAEPPQDWHLHDADGPYRATNVHKAYRTILADRQPKQRVVVAVMDSGVDVTHEDLRPHIWTNDDEIPGNGLDDDGNGYVDDVHGWNFVVEADGTTRATDTYEVTRQLARLRPRFAGVDSAAVPAADRADYARYRSLQAEYDARKVQMTQAYAGARAMLEGYREADRLLAAHLGAEPTAAQVEALETDDAALQQARDEWLKVDAYGLNAAQLEARAAQLGARVDVAFRLDDDPRAGVYEADSVYYGNADLYGPDPFHGTHVAGLIGAVRGNGVGIDGIAPSVAVMPIRSTPQGDERDRDVANGIRYAVDNGADIINMSFGKTRSGNRALVDDAVRYAEAHGVLLVHGSGNDGKDLDTADFFPEPFYADGTEPANWIEVGATSWRTDERFAAFFSNYGRRTVDVFAPGRRIYSAQPGDRYAAFDGTSLSAPIVSGIAALIMSHYPELTAAQVRDAILGTARSYAGEQVRRPNMQGDETLVDFGTLSSTGGVVDAYAALLAADAMARE